MPADSRPVAHAVGSILLVLLRELAYDLQWCLQKQFPGLLDETDKSLMARIDHKNYDVERPELGTTWEQ